MTSQAVQDAVSLLRRAGLLPTQQRLTLATLAFSGPTVALTCDDVCDRANDAGITLANDVVEKGLEELRQAGVLPRTYHSIKRGSSALDRASQVLQAMANPHRLGVIRELAHGERCAGELGRAVGLQPSALSQHLSRLRADGLVRQRREASRIYYSLNGGEAIAILNSIADC